LEHGTSTQQRDSEPGSVEDSSVVHAPASSRASTTLERARRRFAPGLVLGQKLAAGGAVEQSAQGARVLLSDGREALDFGSYAVTLLGHRHPAIIAAVEAQLRSMPTSTRSLANPTVAEFADELVEFVGHPSLQRVWFGSDGADAVEFALKLTRLATGRARILAVQGGYHGKSIGALAATWNPRFRAALLGTVSAVTHLDPSDPGAARRELAHGDVAALIYEPIQGEGGVRPLPSATLAKWVTDVRAAGAMVVADEIQVGLRRCGPRVVCLADGLAPDAVLLGKALGGGVMPLSAAVCSEALFAPLRKDPFLHTSTFGGHPLACAAGRAALRVIDELAPQAADRATQFGAGLNALAARHGDLVREVRGRGLLRGLVLSSKAVAGAVLVELGQRLLIVSPCLSEPETIRLLPPMVASADDVDEALAILDSALHVGREYA